MKLVESVVRHNQKNKAIGIKYYDLDVTVNYDDIGSILEVLPRNYFYNGFDISEIADEGYGYSEGFYNLAEMEKFYYSHGTVSQVDLFSFNMIDGEETISFRFSVGDAFLKVVGNAVSFDMNSFVSQIEQNVINNKKKLSGKL